MEDGTSISLGHTCGTEAAQDVRDTLDRVGDKWSLLVIATLGTRPRRFMELKRELESISQRMLTLTLRHLERDGLVLRTVFPEIPPRVEYRLTPLGDTLLESIQSLVYWTLDHRQEIAQARSAYDARHNDDDAAGPHHA